MAMSDGFRVKTLKLFNLYSLYLMLEKILSYERDAFFALNGSDSVFLDHFMWLYSGKAVWLPLAVFILIVLLYKKNWRESLCVLLAIVLVVTLCDQFASHICKPLFTRFRPTHHPDFMNEVKTVFDYRGGQYGFISSHAANAFGFATLLALIVRNKWLGWTLFIWATLTAYSRIYLGVHFISDIVPGILVGLFFGYVVYRLFQFACAIWLLVPEGYSKRQALLMIYAIVLTVGVMILFSEPLALLLRP